MDKKLKTMLLNLPSSGIVYSRDYFCSKTLKGRYVEQPVDLVMLSGILSQEYDVHVLDATMQQMTHEACVAAVRTMAPDIIVTIIGTVSLALDSMIMRDIRAVVPGARIIGLGDVLFQSDLERFPWLDAILFDFTTHDILAYLRGDYAAVNNMIFRSGKKIVRTERRAGCEEKFTIPVPHHDLFLDRRYSFPCARHLPFLSILTDFGCPFHCRFCVYPELGHKQRPVANVIEEMDYIRSLGVRELFIKDQTFGADRDRALALCDAMRRKEYGFSWSAFSRVDVVDRELLQAMKDAGCHTVMFGVESASQDILNAFHKNIRLDRVREVFALCRQIGMRTLGTFMLGFPGESEERMRATVALAHELRCDFASFNVFVPKQMSGCADVGAPSGFDQSGVEHTTAGTDTMSVCLRIQREAVRRFYFSPAYVWQRMCGMRTCAEMRILFNSAIGLLGDYVRIRRKRSLAK